MWGTKAKLTGTCERATEPTLPASAAEREAAVAMLDQVAGRQAEGVSQREITLGADAEYQEGKFIAALRERGVAPHVSEYRKGKASLGKNALSEAERSDPRRWLSQQKRKLIERLFGWAKLDRPLKQIKLRGLKRVDWFYRLVVTAYNLMRLGKLIPIPAPVG
jgi:IS5 family transposase